MYTIIKTADECGCKHAFHAHDPLVYSHLQCMQAMIKEWSRTFNNSWLALLAWFHFTLLMQSSVCIALADRHARCMLQNTWLCLPAGCTWAHCSGCNRLGFVCCRIWLCYQSNVSTLDSDTEALFFIVHTKAQIYTHSTHLWASLCIHIMVKSFCYWVMDTI